MKRQVLSFTARRTSSPSCTAENGLELQRSQYATDWKSVVRTREIRCRAKKQPPDVTGGCWKGEQWVGIPWSACHQDFRSYVSVTDPVPGFSDNFSVHSSVLYFAGSSSIRDILSGINSPPISPNSLSGGITSSYEWKMS